MNTPKNKSGKRRFLWITLSSCTLLLISCGIEAERTDHVKAAYKKTEETNGQDRKIIYTARIELIVSDLISVEKSLVLLVKEHGGYLAQITINQTSGQSRTGNWEARIPVDKFDSFKDAISKLGFEKSKSQTAQDVTEEFIDLEARITNKKKLEERIIDLLKEKSGKIADIIEVERELARVRGEIEQMEGRIRFLSDQTEMTTVKIFAQEKRDYVPPKAPTFPAQIGQAWGDSLSSLISFCEKVVVSFIYAVPWLVSILVLLLPALLILRRRKSK